MTMLSRRVNRYAVFLGALGVLAGCGSSSSGAGSSHGSPSAAPTYSVPPASAVVDRGKYRIGACPTAPPSRGGTWFTAQSIKGKPGSGTWTATQLIDVGTIGLSDGELWDNGSEFLAGQTIPNPGTKVPAGNPHVVLLLATSKDHHGAVAAVEVHVTSSRPTTWKQVDALGGSTQAGGMAIAGEKMLAALRAVRSLDDAFGDLDATKSWVTPCLRYSLAVGPANGPSPLTAVLVHLPGSGAWPGAIGYDKAGKVSDVVVSIGLLPWSLLGLPGTPPSQAAAVEPTASTTATSSP